jgi:hypothetical protein
MTVSIDGWHLRKCSGGRASRGPKATVHSLVSKTFPAASRSLQCQGLCGVVQFLRPLLQIAGILSVFFL